MMACLAAHGVPVEVVCGTTVDAPRDDEPAQALAARGLRAMAEGGTIWEAVGPGAFPVDTPVLRTTASGVPVAILQAPLRPHDEPSERERRGLLDLFDQAVNRSRPDVLLTYGGDLLTRELLERARHRGIATVFALHNFAYLGWSDFPVIDAAIVPSEYAARQYSAAMGLACAVLPNALDSDRVLVDRREPTYLTFVNPSPEKGVYPFARIADELGRERPDIPILVVEGRGGEATVANCGLDLRRHGTVFFLRNTPDPRRFWSVTRICLIPSLFRETHGMVATEALANGIPVLASDRGALPETLGDAGVTLPLPDHLTPESRHLPSPDEVAPWVKSIVRLWDDLPGRDALGLRARGRARRWSPERLGPLYARFFEGLR